MMDKTIDHRLAWLAGIIDGEGWIGFGVRTFRAGSYPHARFFVEVGNTDAGMISEIQAIASILGVPVSVTHRRFGDDSARKPMLTALFRSRGAVTAVLLGVLPYLITKRPQAELALRALSHRLRRGAPGYISAGSDAAFAEMVSENHRLNRRGVAPKEE